MYPIILWKTAKLCHFGKKSFIIDFSKSWFFLIGLNPELWQGHSDTWAPVYLFIAALALCFGLFSFWKVNLLKVKSFACSTRFYSNITLRLASVIFPSTLTNFPVPSIEKYPQTMMLPPHDDMWSHLTIEPCIECLLCPIHGFFQTMPFFMPFFP